MPIVLGRCEVKATGRDPIFERLDRLITLGYGDIPRTEIEQLELRGPLMPMEDPDVAREKHERFRQAVRDGMAHKPKPIAVRAPRARKGPNRPGWAYSIPEAYKSLLMSEIAKYVHRTPEALMNWRSRDKAIVDGRAAFCVAMRMRGYTMRAIGSAIGTGYTVVGYHQQNATAREIVREMLLAGCLTHKEAA